MFVGLVRPDIFLSVLLAASSAYRSPIPTIRPHAARHPDLLGIAATSYRGGHITVDLVWLGRPALEAGDRRVRTLVLLFVVTVQTYTLLDKVTSTYNDNVLKPTISACGLARSSRWPGRGRRLGRGAEIAIRT